MTQSNGEPRVIRVPILTRVEGEGALDIRFHGREPTEVHLRIYEPPRFFEAFLRGRPMEDVADITSRICGICPIAYQMTAVQALESIQGVKVSQEIRWLRRLVYCAEWIESHVLHIHLLHAPDFFGCASAMELAKQFPDEVKRGLKLKKLGNQLLEILGGRAIHPVNLAIGGFYRLPRREELDALIPEFERGLAWATEAARWLAKLEFPSFESNYEFVALSHPEEYAIEEGEIKVSDGTAIPTSSYEEHFQEVQVPHSTALQSRRVATGGTYFVGPLARIQLNFNQLTPHAKTIASEIGIDPSCRNPHRSILARAIEVVYAFEEALKIMKRRAWPSEARKALQNVVAGEGISATEAPRGLIFHRYRVDETGKIEFAKIVPPTSQNQSQIESDLRQLLPTIADKQDQQIAIDCERLVRSYDPCISCSTHFLKVNIARDGLRPE